MLSFMRKRFANAMGFVLVCIYTLALSGGDALIGIPFLFLLWKIHYILPLAYFLWLYVDRRTPFEAGRRFEWARRLFIWDYFANYFPVHFHKTTDLDPTRNYMFGFHPHGVFSVSCFANFITEAGRFSEKFPGLTMHGLTVNLTFNMTLWRDLALAFGVGSVHKDSIQYKLTKLGPGHSVVIVPGGVADLELSDPANPYQIKLKSRCGFVRQALIAGAPLVPVFSFGESEVLYTTKPSPDSLYGRLYAWSRSVLGGGPLKVSGRCFLVPFRKPVHTVVGAPLELPRLLNPTDDEVNYWHQKYIAALKEVFYENRGRFGRLDKDLELF